MSDGTEVSVAGVAGISAYLKGYDVLDVALTAGEPRTAWAAVLEELEVLDRRSLLNVALVLATETTVVLTPLAHRPAFRQAIDRRRVGAMASEVTDHG